MSRKTSKATLTIDANSDEFHGAYEHLFSNERVNTDSNQASQNIHEVVGTI